MTARVAPVVVEEVSGAPSELHEDRWPVAGVVTVRLCSFTDPALVIGSTQSKSIVGVVDGIEVVQRRSGGGAVLLIPGDSVWIDVYVPSTDRRWRANISRSFGVVGSAWVLALDAAGLTVHDGGLDVDQLGRLVCFAGVGPGEVLDGSRKLVGIAQRRTRWGSRFQCLVHHRFDAAMHSHLLGLEVDAEVLDRRVAVMSEPARPAAATLLAERLAAALQR